MRMSWRLVADVIAPALFTCWIGYFIYDAALSATGYRALRGLEAEVEVKTAEVEALAAERRRLEMIAQQLNPQSLDPDMAEEKIRSVLGYVEKDDLVISREELDLILEAAAAARAGG